MRTAFLCESLSCLQTSHVHSIGTDVTNCAGHAGPGVDKLVSERIIEAAKQMEELGVSAVPY